MVAGEGKVNSEDFKLARDIVTALTPVRVLNKYLQTTSTIISSLFMGFLKDCLHSLDDLASTMKKDAIKSFAKSLAGFVRKVRWAAKNTEL